MRAKIYTAIALCLLLATTAGLVAFGLYHHEKAEYIGTIPIKSQEEYSTFLNSIFAPGIRIDLLGTSAYGVRLPTQRAELEATKLSFPELLVFYLYAEHNPVAEATLINHSPLPFKIVPMTAIAMVGYGTALGLWLGRKGFTYTKQKVARCTT